jgi:predicted nucleotidyltransferase
LLARFRRGRAAAEARRRSLVAAAERAIGELAAEGIIAGAWLIGSTVWDGFGERSDIDIVVRGLDISRRGEIETRLSESCRGPVDLLRWEELDAPFQARVAREGVRIA